MTVTVAIAVTAGEMTAGGMTTGSCSLE